MSIRWILVAGVVLVGLLLLLSPSSHDRPCSTAQGPFFGDESAGLGRLGFDAFVAESFRLLQLRDPDTLIWGELAEQYGVEGLGQYSDVSPSYLAETYAIEKRVLEMLRSRDRDRDALTADQHLTYDIYEWYLDDLVSWHGFAGVDYCNNPYDLQNAIVDFLVTFPIRCAADAEACVERLAGFGAWIDQVLEGYRLHEQAGALPPQYLIQRALAMTGQYVPSGDEGIRRAAASPLHSSLRKRLAAVASVTQEDAEALLVHAEDAIEQAVIPAFARFEAYLRHLEDCADNGITALRLPDGVAYYAASLRHHTTTEWTPAQIHERARYEVARLLDEMRKCAAGLGWPEGLAADELDRRITEANPPLEGDVLLADYQRLIDRATTALPGYFARLPKAGLIVEVNPDSTFAYYAAPTLDGSKPGRMITNLVSAVPYTAYDEPVLMHHETVPGHHLQIALAQELGLPNFRRDTITSLYSWHPHFQPYVEGWALYAEGLAAEIGLYDDDPIGNLCRLRLELQRTARSVVDTGIHAYGWTWKEAAAYLEETTGVRPRQSAMLRYFTQPGQSCGYTLGMWTIRDLRRRAMDRLGEAFDIREFHRAILEAGSMPLCVLEQCVQDWIAESPKLTE